MGDEGTLAAMARGQMTRILFIFSEQGGEARREGLKICSQGLTCGFPAGACASGSEVT